MSGSMSKGQEKTTKTMRNGVNTTPDGYHSVTPYMMVKDAQKLLDFLTKAFDAKVGEKMMMPDGKIAHVEVRIGDSFLMMSDEMADTPAMPIMLYHYVDNADAVFKKALAAGGTQIQEVKDQFYGDHAGCVKDPVGNTWWIATHIEDVPSGELQKRAKEQMKGMQKH